MIPVGSDLIDPGHLRPDVGQQFSRVAALKSNNFGVPIFRDDVREYLEIAVLTAVLRAAAKPMHLGNGTFMGQMGHRRAAMFK